MRIAVNTRFLMSQKMEGFGWFTHEVFQRIATQHPEHEFIFIFDRKFDSRFIYAPNITAVKTFIPARSPMLFDVWFNRIVPKILRKYKADVFISPDGYLSLTTDIKQIAVIHDLNFEHFPNDLKPNITRYYKNRFPKFATKANHIITVSEFSKQDIVSAYNVSSQKITVSHNGADEAFVKLPVSEINKFKNKFSLTKKYFLAVGSIHPRKNIQRLLQAFDAFCDNEKNYCLVIAGSKYNWTDGMNKTFSLMKNKNAVVFTGHLSKQDLICAYSGAEALIFSSYFEGFGIPLVEAMRCECAVICSNATCFPEVAGDAALFFNAFDVNDIADKMIEFASDEKIKSSLIAKGNERVKQFTWQHSADRIWKVIESVIHA